MPNMETLYHHAIFHAMDGAPRPASAMLVRGNRIAAIGALADVESLAGSHTRRINLDGRAVIPGFNDCHCHIIGIGLDLLRVNVSPDACKDIAGVMRAVRERSEKTPEGEWVLGQGYDQNALVEKRHPNRYDLDAAASNRPVVLWHTSMHVVVANSAALTVAGVSNSTDDPAGGEIERDEHGEPTGVLKESARELVLGAIPPLTPEAGRTAISAATRLMTSLGITSATDAATGDGPSVEPELAMYRRAAESGLPLRISLLPEMRYVAPPGASGAVPPSDFDAGDAPAWLRIGGVKLFADGAMSTRTAAMRAPYVGEPENQGILIWEPAVMADMIDRAHHAGWRIATHALGDRAVATVLDCYQAASDAASGVGPRHRMEHCMVMDDDLCRRMRELRVVPVMQPDIFRLGDGYIDALGLERACDVIPMQRIARHGIQAAFSSDAPVVPCDPLLNIRSAIERITPSGVQLGSDQAVAVMEAIRLYTTGGAYATHCETEKGTLRPGMLADFVVLSRNPADTPREEWTALRVIQTIVDGEVRFEA